MERVRMERAKNPGARGERYAALDPIPRESGRSRTAGLVEDTEETSSGGRLAGRPRSSVGRHD